MISSTNPAVARVPIVRFDNGHAAKSQMDSVAREEPLEIRVRGRSVAVTMRTPGHDEELAAGFLLTEGLIHGREDVVEIAHCAEARSADNTLNVFLAASVEVDLERLTRHVFASSSCGLCGKATLDAVQLQFPPVSADWTIEAALLSGLPAVMRREQRAFAETGGLHAAALFSRSGELLVLREDVGRHNAVDKVLGRAFLDGRFPCDDTILLISGRASFEIVQKARAARVPMICAVSAPSSLAIELAVDGEQTLVGFLRGGGMNIYAHPRRIVTAS